MGHALYKQRLLSLDYNSEVELLFCFTDEKQAQTEWMTGSRIPKPYSSGASYVCALGWFLARTETLLWLVTP